MLVRRRRSSEAPCDITTDAAGPRFSVVIPAFNEERFIAECLQSLARQDFTGGHEVIVVDNNSTDDTAEIARRYGAIVVREETPGVCAARHRGTLAARGQIVVSSDADTVFDAGWLSRIDRTFRQEPTLVAVAGPCRYPDGPWWGRAYARILFDLVYLNCRVTGRPGYITATNIAFRKDAWTGYDLTGTQGADELGLLRQLSTRGKMAFDRQQPHLHLGASVAAGTGVQPRRIVLVLLRSRRHLEPRDRAGRHRHCSRLPERSVAAGPRRYRLRTRVLGLVGWPWRPLPRW